MQLPEIVEHEGVLVVRDDVYPGGTKARVLSILFNDAEEYVYASPVQGYAQVALAHAARANGKRATVFCAHRHELHPRTAEAQAAGARIVPIRHGYMNVVRHHARNYCQVSGAVMLPFGLNCVGFISALTGLAMRLPVKPHEVWTVADSGVLSRALQVAWPDAEFNAVRVGAAPNAGRALVHLAPETFDQDAQEPPPFPSCSNYDAKAWRFIRQYASPGALFWNVAA